MSNVSARGPLTLALTLFGSGALLLLGRQALLLRPLPTPASPMAQLERTRQWDPDPQRRREASLLLVSGAEANPARRQSLLAGQGWGPDPLAALVLKRDAQSAEAVAQGSRATALWRQLLRRFPSAPATADALYALGREEPRNHQTLWRRFPAHPAALAAAVEAGPGAAERRAGALHLARWGARWPGAEQRIRQACGPSSASLSPDERSQLAGALAQLGDGPAALSCLGRRRGTAGTELALGRALLKGTEAESAQGEQRLLALIQGQPASGEAAEASRLLSQRPGPGALALLAGLPPALRQSAPVQARLALESGQGWRQVLTRWPADPASWDLAWELARQKLLKREWAAAAELLGTLNPEQLPTPLAVRQLFWLGYAEQQLGQAEQARRRWQQQLLRSLWGYYGWRATVRLGEEGSPLRLKAPAAPTALQPSAWQPLQSGQLGLDRLWRLNQPLEAWEEWRHQRGNRPPVAPERLILEGRLRQGVGDDWMGLAQLEQASLLWVGVPCPAALPLERSLHPVRHGPVFAGAAAAAGLDPTLLLAVAKQESRFSAGVASPAGAVGLLQLMPATAAELAGRSVTNAQLRQPQLNAQLSARYLAGLLRQWQGNPFLTIASYNAGPAAVQTWLTPTLRAEPELWVEAIPFPETRIYAKKVLGSLWTYQQLDKRGCKKPGS
ncbi:lytic transglycosylase domain-containing protein [Synechococcus sp. Tobar12-5m-g]|uniref:lytic transglycosylase domain-containing protein n=1 Tax=unclassified Synechococcus TaxID=2626047 RepID=UPI0020CB6B28|nr:MULTISPECIES: lytic transglycosylase domain-containing protein [unclassified Synechococcus]MCP9771913.1 lytic transglycosylase domain-containing protein [Synechococcus sp. Tobar12-5m-g]MCP9872855.1 lytic transglycosylase domain-containing protein [Synechococcus sp. Cruz CV-v-12]